MSPAGLLGPCVVCDGMGGAKAGNVASKLAVDTFVRVPAARDQAEAPDEAGPLLASAAEQANEAVYLRAVHRPGVPGMGTTMVAALVVEHRADILNIGDSRCYHITGEGIARVTRDHSVVEALVQRGDLTPEAARVHPQKNLITRALGAEAHVRADLYHQELHEGDCLLLCSDGLSNLVSEQEILYEILHGGERRELLPASAGHRPSPGRAGQRDSGPDPLLTAPVMNKKIGRMLPWINT